MKRTRLLTAGLIAALTPVLTAMLATPATAQSRDHDEGRDHNAGPPARAGRDTMLRAGPMGSYPGLRRIQQGEPVQLYGCLNDRSWCDVRYGNERGWIAAPDLYAEYDGRQDSVVNLWGNLNPGGATFTIGDYWDDHYRQQPFYDDRSRWEAQYFDNYQDSWGPRPGTRRWSGGDGVQLAVMLRRSWLFAGPDWRYPRAGILYPQATVTITGCLRDWSWCDVAYRGNRGWVPASHMAGTWQGRRQSINLIAPLLGIGIRPFLFQTYWNDHYRGQPFYRQRGHWEGQYRQNYRQVWGPGPRATPNQAWQAPRQDKPGMQPRVDERAYPDDVAPDPIRRRGEPQARANQKAHMRGQWQGQEQAREQGRAQEQVQRDHPQPQKVPGGPEYKKPDPIGVH